MPTYYARKAGNINAADVWATTPSGVAAAVTFASGDVLVANSFAITINVDTNLGGSGQVRNDTLGGATAGGTFTLNAGVTLTANVLQNNTTAGATVVLFSASAPSQAWIVGNVTSPVNTSGGSNPIFITGSGTLNFTGNATGDLKSAGTGGAIGFNASGTLNFTGNATGGGGSLGYAIDNRLSGTVNITGNCYGAVAPAVGNISTGTVTINGQAIGSTTTGGGAGVANLSTGGVIVKRAIGGSYGPGSTGVTAAPGVANSLTGLVSVEEIEFGANGMSPTSGGGIRLKKANTNVAVFNYCDTAGAKTLIDATANAAMPAATNVRSGVSYASGALVGSCAVPAAGSVALGVPVDNTTGTAVLTQADVQSALTAQGLTTARAGNLDNLDATVSSRLAPSGTLATVTTLTNAPASVTASDIWSYATRTTTGGTVDTLTNAPSVPSASAIASQVRTELGTELGRIDQNISSRLAASAYTAPTTPPTAAEIATAVEGSLLNEADGQAVLNAIVGAIGNTNLSEVSLVAAVRADLERNGGKLDNIPTTSAPSASTVASAVRTELGTELGRIDAAISSRLAAASYTAPTTPPTAEQNASAVRTELSTELARIDAPISGATAPSAATVASAVRSELSTELGRVDAAVSTRLASTAATDLAAVKAKTDQLNTDRLANVATTNIVGTLLAQANS